MRFLVLIFINLRRHRGRALIGIAGIAFGVAAMFTIVAIVSGAIGMFEHILATDSDLLVFEKNTSDLFFSSVKTQEMAELSRLPQVESCRPLLFGIVSSPGHPVITCFGLDRNDSRLVHANWLEGQRDDFGAHPEEIFLGSRAASFLQVKRGDRVEIGPTHFVVGGILKLENGFEDGGAFLPLAQAQAFFHRPETFSVVAIKLRNRADGTAFKHAVEQSQPRLVALENREFNQNYNSFRILRATSWAVGACAFLLGGLGVANTMLMSVFSRIREIAILRVCGFSQAQVTALIFGEALALALIGWVIGAALSAMVLLILPHLGPLQGYVQATISPLILVVVAALALSTAVLGALYPARFAGRIQPADALRYE